MTKYSRLIFALIVMICAAIPFTSYSQDKSDPKMPKNSIEQLLAEINKQKEKLPDFIPAVRKCFSDNRTASWRPTENFSCSCETETCHDCVDKRIDGKIAEVCTPVEQRCEKDSGSCTFTF